MVSDSVTNVTVESSLSPRSYRSCAAGGREPWRYYDSSKTAYVAFFTAVMSTSIKRMFQSVEVYPMKILVKSCVSTLDRLSPDFLTQTRDPKVFNRLRLGRLPFRDSKGVFLVLL